MEATYAARAIGRVLSEEGVTKVFSIHGASTYPMLYGISGEGINMYHMRHEQSAGYAADGFARASQQLAACTVMGGVGMQNILPAISHCNLVHSPILVFVGQHASSQDGMKTWFESYGTDMSRPVTKWSHRVVEPHALAHNVRKAVHIATSFPPGPVLLEIPWNVSITRVKHQLWDVDPLRRPNPIPPQGSFKAIQQLVEMMMEAKKPLIIAGDGVFWSNASDQLKEVVKAFNVPVHCRRMGRGAIPESDPASASGEQRQRLLREADLIVMIGLEASFFDDWFQPPNWNHDCKYVQIHENPELVFLGLPTELTVIGSPKLVLQQCLDVMDKNKTSPPDREEWMGLLQQVKARHKQRLQERVQKLTPLRPIHPDLVASQLVDVLDHDATIILDSFTLSGYVSEHFEASFPGQVLDAGLQIAVGHSVGIAIGAQLARPGKQIVSLIGDGGVGISGMDIETAVRYGLTPLFIILNNNSWGGRATDRKVLWSRVDSWDITPSIRYDSVFQEMGCHGENVQEPNEIRPALERALASGKASVINVVGDADAIAPPAIRTSFIECWGRGDIEQCPPETKDLYRAIRPGELERIAAWANDWGFEASAEDLRDYIASAE